MATPVATPTSLSSLLSYFPRISNSDKDLIERAYHKAEIAHEGQKRKSGEPFFIHCVAVATILAEMHLDAEAIAAALLHDTIEDTSVTYEEIEREFGRTIAQMVDAVTKLEKLPKNTDPVTGKRSSNVSRHREYMRKMLLSMDADVRIVLIKLADRLHNMRTLGYMKPEKRVAIARETMDYFAPLANRLGIWQIKWELEDLCFRHLEPDAYSAIARSIDERRADREAYMEHIATKLTGELQKYGLQDVKITSRPKHIYSIYRKMQRKQTTYDQIFDVRAVRVITNSVVECYQILGIVHNLWRPIPNEFDDYIASPKDNFYQSLHTAVYDENGKVVEVQIRTLEMHEHAEYGIAAHWRYKESDEAKQNDEKFEQRINYLRHLMEFGPEIRDDPEIFLDTMKSEVFQDRVYVFTPKGDIFDLPMGATPVDLAYHIHTDIGHRCRGAKVHGQLVSLNYRLKTGDQVEIMPSKRGGPSMDWLNENLGYVTTSRARAKIKHYFRKLNRDKHIDLGRELLEREFKRLGVSDTIAFEHVAHGFEYSDVANFFAAVGSGDISGAQISNFILDKVRHQKMVEDESALLKAKQRAPMVYDDAKGVKIMGAAGLLTNLGTCCNPMPGDSIVGYITRGRGVTVHRTDCPNVSSLLENDNERIISVSWGGLVDENMYSVPVEIVAYDREGLIRDISTVIADQRVNILDVRVTTRGDIATIYLKLEIGNNSQLTRILDRIGMIPSVTETYRCNS